MVKTIKTFSRAGPGGQPEVSKLLRTFRYRPNIISLPTKVLFTVLIITRIVLSIIPTELHP